MEPDNRHAEDPVYTKLDWIKPRAQPIPRPTYAPAVTAIAVVCVLWGLVTTFLISLLGLVLLVAGLADWIGELRHERE